MRRLPHHSIWGAAGFLIAIFVVASPLTVLRLAVDSTMYPRIWVGHVSLGWMTTAQAQETIEKMVGDLRDQGIRFHYNDKEVTVPFEIRSLASEDISRQLVEIKTDKPLLEAYGTTREDAVIKKLKSMIRVLVRGKEIPLEVTMERDEIKKLLTMEFAPVAPMPREPQLVLKEDMLVVEPGQPGVILDLDAALQAAERTLRQGLTPSIAVSATTQIPTYTESDLLSVKPTVEKILKDTPLKILFEDREWVLKKTTALSWLTFERQADTTLRVVIPSEAIRNYLTDLARTIETEAAPARFELEKNGRVVKFEKPREGRALDYEASERAIRTALEGVGGTAIVLTTRVSPPPDPVTDIGDLAGIRELIGVGVTRFRGSPPGRRHNIKIGAASLHGLIIKPGEEFSLVKAIGNVDDSTGYRQELVIKGDKVTKEFGGGLCQIATTVFRAAMDSGLPITERRNHSLRVAYYEPPIGKDATIYGPHPDLKFKNDTGYPILIQTHIQGDELRFEFWGTRDGRLATQTDPIVWNQRPAPPTKLVETDELPPGEKNCSGHAYAGASAKFTYTVTYPDGRKFEKEYTSHYRPLAQICLVGRTTPTPPPTNDAPAPTLPGVLE